MQRTHFTAGYTLYNCVFVTYTIILCIIVYVTNKKFFFFIMPDLPDLHLQELHWTNKPKAEQIHATRLGYTAQTIYLLGPELRASLDHMTPLYTMLGDEESCCRINNILVKYCEKHSNPAQDYVKATDIRTNATDVETRKNIVQ